MKIAYRRLLYAGATALFALISPLLILYAQGYRFDIRAMRFLRTGGLVINSEPKRAQLLLDGTILRETTPLTILNLLPGEYEVMIRREGYQPWHVRVRVRSHVSTKIEAVLMPSVLNLTSLPVANILSLAPTRDGTKIAMLTSAPDGAGLGIYDHRRRTYHQLAVVQPGVVDDGEVRWSANNKFLAARLANKRMIVLQAATGVLEPLPALLPSAIQKGSWDYRNDNFFYVVANETLWKIDLFSHTATALASPGVLDLGFHNDSLWIVRRGSEGSTIEEIEKETPNTRRRVITVRSSIEKLLYIDSSRAVVQHGTIITLLDSDGLQLAAIRIDESPVRPARDQNGRYLLLSTSTEVWAVNINASTFTLLGRFGALQGASWLPHSPVALILRAGVLTEISAEQPTAWSGSFGPFAGATTLYPLNGNSVGIVTRDAVLLANLEL